MCIVPLRGHKNRPQLGYPHSCLSGVGPICSLLQCGHNGCDSVSNHQPHDRLLNRLFRRRSTKTSKLRVTGLCAGNSPGTSEFAAQMASYAENVYSPHKWPVTRKMFPFGGKPLSKPWLPGSATHKCGSKGGGLKLTVNHIVLLAWPYLINWVLCLYRGPVPLTIFPSQFKFDGNFILL